MNERQEVAAAIEAQICALLDLLVEGLSAEFLPVVAPPVVPSSPPALGHLASASGASGEPAHVAGTQPTVGSSINRSHVTPSGARVN